jgi:2-keto-4-pentenoate hydratase/2-oxohepta-3-ene-1,7-dioic acid hydratase in catechol pathway
MRGGVYNGIRQETENRGLVMREQQNANAAHGASEPSVSRRDLMSASAMLLAGTAASAATPSPAEAAPQRDRDFGAVASIGERLANLRIEGRTGLGIETDAGVVDVSATARALGLTVPSDMDDLLQNGRGGEIAALIGALKGNPGAAKLVPAAELRFAPLVTRPEKIVCVGFNYRKHAEETDTAIPKAPPLFAKYNNALNSHHGRIKLPTEADTWFDYETELVIVFGRLCKNVSEADALDYVAGYATGNDFSARGLQNASSQFTAGKTADGFAPVGPWLGTPKRVPDPNKLKIKTVVNGEVRQDWTTEDMIYNCRTLIRYASRCMTLKPGDIMYTGTPQGVIWGQKATPPDQRRWLRAGDVVTSSLEGLGDLTVTLD